jgi:hypothetical protein
MMLKQLLAGVAGVAAVAFAGSAMAQTTIDNPWDNEAQVGVNINVGQLGEVWSNLGTAQYRNSVPAPTLQITNAGGTIPASGIAEDTINHFANVNYQVSVQLASGNIPEFSRFHVLVGIQNRGLYNAVGAGLPNQVDAIADTTITFDRRDSATGYIGNQPATAYQALTDTPSTSSKATLVDYAVDAIHGLPAQGGTNVELLWTIAAL